MSSRNPSAGGVVRNVVAGLVGGLVASYVMERSQAAIARLSNGRDDQPHDDMLVEPCRWVHQNQLSVHQLGVLVLRVVGEVEVVLPREPGAGRRAAHAGKGTAQTARTVGTIIGRRR